MKYKKNKNEKKTQTYFKERIMREKRTRKKIRRMEISNNFKRSNKNKIQKENYP